MRQGWLLGPTCLFVVMASAMGPRLARAQGVDVPVPLQASLLVKAAAFDYGLKQRGGDVVHVLVVEKAAIADSHRVATQMKAALEGQTNIAGMPYDVTAMTYDGPAVLATACHDQHIGIAYLSSGFTRDEIQALAVALDGADVLTVAAVAADVPEGIVLGFGLASGRPQLLANLAQARRQNVSLAAGLLSLAKVYR
ncbi:MAG: YfiR family protein [Myxococcota bacterium]